MSRFLGSLSEIPSTNNASTIFHGQILGTYPNSIDTRFCAIDYSTSKKQFFKQEHYHHLWHQFPLLMQIFIYKAIIHHPKVFFQNARKSNASITGDLRFSVNSCVPPLENDFAELIANTGRIVWFAIGSETFLRISPPPITEGYLLGSAAIAP